MVKSTLKQSNKRQAKEKRVNSLTLKIKKNKKKSLKQIKKSKNKTNKTQEKPAYLNYYLKDKINFLNSELIYTINNLVNKENSEFYENIKIIAANNINYREEHRAFILNF
jgi:thymidine kinase